MPVIDEKEYGRLLVRHLPRLIETDEDHDHFTKLLLELTVPARTLSPEEDAFVNLLERLVDDYEEHGQHASGGSSPVELIRDLMEENGLRQIDLVDVFGTSSVLSEVLSGKRQISKEHARRLALRFAIPAGRFI